MIKMKKLSKIALMLVLVGLVTLSMMACESETPGGEAGDKIVEPSLSIAEMIEAITDKHEFSAFMPLDEDMMAEFYHLDAALLEDYVANMPLMIVRSDELTILKVKDVADVDTVKASLEERAADAMRSFESYLIDQYEKAENYKLVTQGNYILFTIADDVDAVVKTFNSFFE